jgi:hypothetical protein
MLDEHNTPGADRQSPWARPKKSTVFEPQSERQRRLIAADSAASANDRAWFEANPGRTLRFRWATHDELEVNREFGAPMLIPPGWAWAVMVRSLGSMRFRAFVELPLNTQLEHASEWQCREFARITNIFPTKIVRVWERDLKARRRSRGVRPKPSPTAHHLAAREAPKPAERQSRGKL